MNRGIKSSGRHLSCLPTLAGRMPAGIVVCMLAVAGLFAASTPAPAQTSATEGLPEVYQKKLDDFFANNKVMKDNDAKSFTLEFVEKEMAADWKISKENQRLFIWHAIYKQITGSDLYDGQDGDQKIADDFSDKAVNLRTRACGQKYHNGITSYMKNLSAEADRRSAEYRQQSAEADRRSAEALTNSLSNLVWFYNRYHNTNLPSIPTEERKDWEEKAKLVFNGCKELNMDYKSILLKELGDEKKLKDLLKFYGIE